MPTVVQGDRTTDTQGTETRRKRDVFPTMLKLEPEEAPLTVLMGKTRKRAATDPKIEWFEMERLPKQDILNAAVLIGDATLTVTNYKYFRAGDIIQIVETGEQVLVTATPAAAAVAVTRAWGEVAAVAAANAGKLRIVGNANEEDALGRDVISVTRAAKFNYLGILREPFAISNTAKVTDTYAGSDFEEDAVESLMKHRVDLEDMFLQGQRYEDVTGIEPRRSTRGIVRWISTLVVNVGGDLTEVVLDAFLRRGFRYGTKSKVLLCAPIVTQAISGFAKSKLRPSDVMMKTYGMALTEYLSPFGKVILANHNLMTNDSLQDFDGLAGDAILVDIGNVEMRHMKGRITQRNENIQANDRDGRIDEYLTEAGLQVGLEKTHGIMSGITG